MQLAAYAGMGELGFVDSIVDIYGRPVGGGTTTTTSTSTGHSTRDAILYTINNLTPSILQAFGRNQVPIAGGFNTQLSQAQLAQYNNGGGGGGVGFGIDSQGIRLSDGSHIGWLPIGGALLALKLLQSKPLRRS